MKAIGYLLIALSTISLIINIPPILAIQRARKSAQLQLNGNDYQQMRSLLSPQLQYHTGLVLLSIGAFPIGIYLAMNGATLSQFFGFFLVFSSIGGVIQSFCTLDTQAVLLQRGDFETSASTMAWRLRIMAAISLAGGVYLLA